MCIKRSIETHRAFEHALSCKLKNTASFSFTEIYEIYSLHAFIMKVEKYDTLKDFYVNASETLESGAQRKLQGLQNHLGWNV